MAGIGPEERDILVGAMDACMAELRGWMLQWAKQDPASFRRGVLGLLQRQSTGASRRTERRTLDRLAQQNDGAYEQVLHDRKISTSLQETVELVASGRLAPLRLGGDGHQ